MREINVLNKNYEKLNLDSIIWENKTIDEPITDLKGLTLRQVFDDSNLLSFSNTSGWLSNGESTITFEGNMIVLTGNTTIALSGRGLDFYKQLTLPIGTVIYSTIDFRTQQLGGTNLRLRYFEDKEFPVVNQNWNNYSRINTVTSAGSISHHWNYMFPIGTNITGFKAYAKNNCVINLLALGLLDVPKDKIDYWFNIFKLRRGVLKNKLSLRDVEQLNVILNGRFDKDTNNDGIANDWFIHQAVNPTLQNGVQKIFSDGLGTWVRINQTQNISALEKYFFRINAKTNAASPNYFVQFSGQTTIQVYGGRKHLNSFIFNPTMSATTLLIYLGNASGQTMSATDYVEYKQAYFFHMKHFDENMTQEKMDSIINLLEKVKYNVNIPDVVFVPDQNTKTKFSIAYTNKTIDEPIPDLNNKTLREVFEGMEINKNPEFTSTIRYEKQQTIFTVNDGVARIEANANNSEHHIWVSPKVQVLPNQRIYQVVDIVAMSNNFMMETHWQKTDNSYTSVHSPNYNTTGRKSRIFNVHPDYDPSKDNQLRLQLYFGSSRAFQLNGAYVELKMFRNIKMTGFENLTVQQMDYYYSLYLLRRTSRKKHLTYNDIFEDANLNTNNMPDISKHGLSYAYNGDGTWYVNGTATVNSEQQTMNSSIAPGNGNLYMRGVDEATLPYQQRVDFRSNNAVTLFNSIFTGSNKVLYFDEVAKVNLRPYITISAGATVNRVYRILLVNLDKLGMTEITELEVDTLFNEYLSIKNSVVFPTPYTPIEPTGFGNRYIFNDLNKKIYGHELNFENMQINFVFGLYWNAYDGFNQLMKFISNNEAIIEYNYGKGERYTDVRLVNAPKTEIEQGNIIRSKFDFKRLTPFYTILEGASLVVTNDHDWDLKMIVEGTVNTNTVFIEAENLESGPNQVVKFNFTSVTKPFNFYYNSETKQILINGVNNGYQYIDQSAGISFISVPKGEQHSLFTTGITNPKIKVKKWVID